MPLNNDNNNECCKCTTPEYTIILNEQGPQGRQGNQGNPGFSPQITVKTDTASVYQLNITTVDGTITTPNLKSGLPTGGVQGSVLTKNSDVDGDVSFKSLPNAQTNQAGIVQLADTADLSPDSEGEVDDTKAVTPKLLVDTLTDYQKTDTAITTSDIATVDKLGIVKPDGTTITILPDGTISSIGGITEIPQATATSLGGIKANEKDDTDTQEVKIDPATGILYTQPGGGNITSIDGGNAQTNGVVAYQNTTFYANSAIVNNGLVGQDKVTIQDGEV